MVDKAKTVKRCYNLCVDDCKHAKKKSPKRCSVDCCTKCIQHKNHKFYSKHKLVHPKPRRQWSGDLPTESDSDFSSSNSSSSNSSSNTSSNTSSSSNDSLNNLHR